MTVESGWLLASGEALYADFNYQESGNLPLSGQVPRVYDGINVFYPSPENQESGVLFTYSANSGIIDQVLDSGSLSGITNSVFSRPPAEFTQNTNVEYADLGEFYPYVHYYPKFIPDPTSLFGAPDIPVPILIDYSLVFAPSSGYNTYGNNSFNYNETDSSGNYIFDEDAAVLPTKFGLAQR